MKKVNVLICLALSMVLLFSPAVVSAENDDFVDSPYCVVDDAPKSRSGINVLNYTSLKYYSLQDTPNGEYYETDNYTLGKTITAYYPDYTQVSIINTNAPLRSDPGEFVINLFAQGDELKITTYFTNGGSRVYTFDPKTWGENYSLTVKIPNSSGDVKNITIELLRHIPGLFITPTSVLRVDDFGYNAVQTSSENLLVDFFKTFFSDFKNTIIDLFADKDMTSAIDKSTQLENGVINDIGRLTHISLYEDFLNIQGLVNGFFFISGYLTLMFANLRISIVLHIIVTLVMVTTVLGFARQHKK